MKKIKYILPFVIVVAVFSFLYFQTNVSATEEVVEEIPVVKVYTKLDTLLFNYDSLLIREMDSLGSVGAAWVITYQGRIVLLDCYGQREFEGMDPINEYTLFRLASVSKTITGVLAGILSAENTIGLDDKVIDYLPDFKLKDSINTRDLSIRNILSHTSGLVPHAYDNLVEAQVPFSIIIDSLQRVNIADVPGKLYGYQNVVFSLYDTITRIKTGKKFEDLLQEKVFIPFRMDHASAGFEAFANSNNRALPHRPSNGAYKTLTLNDRYYNTNPAAGINASISDLGNFLIAFSGNDSSLLTPDVAKEVLSPQVNSPLRWNYLRKWDRVDSKQYALGWRIIGYKGRQVAYHGGYVQGYRAEIALCPEEEIGIAFLTNSPNGAGSAFVPDFLDMYFEMKDKVSE